jgi:hypothetical protein
MFSMPLTISFYDDRLSTPINIASNDTSVGIYFLSNLSILIKAFIHLSVINKCLKYYEFDTLANKIDIYSDINGFSCDNKFNNLVILFTSGKSFNFISSNSSFISSS